MEPKPCPFCGERNVGMSCRWINRQEFFYVICSNCSAEGSKTRTRNDAIERWNSICKVEPPHPNIEFRLKHEINLLRCDVAHLCNMIASNRMEEQRVYNDVMHKMYKRREALDLKD